MDSICARFAIPAFMLAIAGCYHPTPYGGWQGQPQYIAPQQGPGYMQNPGTLVIPESNAPLHVPGSSTNTYDDPYNSNEETDGFRTDPNGSYYGNDGGVPAPQEPGSGSDSMFDKDFGT